MLATITTDDNPRSSRVSIWHPLINGILGVFTVRYRGNTVADEGKTAAGPRRKSNGGRNLYHASSYIHFNALDIMYSIVIHNAIDRWNICIQSTLAMQNVRDMKDTDEVLDYS